MVKENEQQLVRKSKLEELIRKNLNPYEQSFTIKNDIHSLIKKYDSFTKEELLKLENNEFSFAGRIMLYRDQGKVIFLNLFNNESIQLYLRQDAVSENSWIFAKSTDLGDIIFVKGSLMKTNKNELTLRPTTYKIISKSILPLPDKHHGLTNIEERYRKRYLDLIVNKASFNVFKTRTKIINSIREYLNNNGYDEVETPFLQSILGGALAKPFETHHNALDMEFYLRIATELPLKKLIVGGYNKVYEIGRIFRNEGIDSTHNPEFTSIEIYEAYGDMNSMINITESILSYINKSLNNDEIIDYQGVDISLKIPFKRIEMNELVKNVTGVDFSKMKIISEAKTAAKENNIKLEKHHTGIGHILNEFFEQKCESSLINPTFVTGYPIEVSPLAKKRLGSDMITDRFELFIHGREYANGFNELNDPVDQLERFKNQLNERKLGNSEANEIDYDYINALNYALPPTGGLGIGIDRVVMLFTNSKSIRDVILFPHQKLKTT